MPRQPVTSEKIAPELARWEATHRSPKIPPALRAAHPVAVMLALRAADGDPRRLTVDEDGAVTSHNERKW